MTVMYFYFITIKQTVIQKTDCTGRESKHVVLFSFVCTFHPKVTNGHNLLGGTHKQSLNSCQLDEQLKEDLISRDAHPFSNTTCYPHQKIPPKSSLSRCVVSDGDSHRGYKLSSVPLSRLSPRQQRGATCTPKCLSHSSHITPSLSVSDSLSTWASVSDHVCLFLMGCLLTCLSLVHHFDIE